MTVYKYNELINEFNNIISIINTLKPHESQFKERFNYIYNNVQSNIELLKKMVNDEYNIDHLTPHEEEIKEPPHRDTHPIDYINNYSWLDAFLKNKIEDIKELYKKTEEDSKLFEYYNKLTDFYKTYFYNKDQVNKIEQFLYTIDNFLIQVAEKSGRYSNRGGSWFIGAGLDVYTRDKPQRKKLYKYRVYSLGYGNGDGQARKLQDIIDILKYYNLNILDDQGRMD